MIENGEWVLDRDQQPRLVKRPMAGKKIVFGDGISPKVKVLIIFHLLCFWWQGLKAWRKLLRMV